MLRLSIKGWSCLIEEKDLWLSEKSSGNSDSLLLATWKFDSSLSNDGVIAIWEYSFITDEYISVWFLACVIKVSIGYYIDVEAIADVLSDTSWEEYWLLRYNSDLLFIPSWLKLFNISSTEKYLSTLWIVKSLNQSNNARLSTAWLSNESHNFIFWNFEIDTLCNLNIKFCWIMEVDVYKLYFSNSFIIW